MGIKRIAVLTTGGDAPGMNAAIRGVVRFALQQKVETVGVMRGWWGLINEELRPLNHRAVSGVINQGGTILKTARCPEFKTEEGRLRAHQNLKKNNIDDINLDSYPFVSYKLKIEYRGNHVECNIKNHSAVKPEKEDVEDLHNESFTYRGSRIYRFPRVRQFN